MGHGHARENDPMRRGDEDKSNGRDSAPLLRGAATPSRRIPQFATNHKLCRSLPISILFNRLQFQTPGTNCAFSSEVGAVVEAASAGMMSQTVAVGRAAPPTSLVAIARQSNNPSSLRSNSGLRQVSWRWQQPSGASPRLEGGFKGDYRGFKGLEVRCKVISVNQESFDAEVLKADVPVLVDFWASWCGPCKLVATSMDVVDRKYAGKLKVVKVETDPNPTLVEKYKVYGLPTLIMFRNGEAMSGGRYEGAISLAKLESLIKKVVPSLAAAN